MSKGKIVAAIQARMGSKRLPCKMMLHLNGYPVIDWVVKRVKRATLVHDVVVAIPETAEDDILAAHIERLDCHIFRGEETDVLNRFFNAAQASSADQVVRICADNPLICGEEIDNLIRHYQTHTCDYAYNHIPRNNRYPDGLGAEILSFSLLEHLESVVTDPHHREHVLTYIWQNRDRYRIETFDPPNENIRHPELRLDIDTIGDYRKLSLSNVRIDSTAEQTVALFLQAER